VSRRPRDQRRRAPQRSFVQRYGYQILSGLVIAGVAALGAYIYLQASRPTYACSALLTVPAATPTPIVTPTPLITPKPSATPTASPSPAATPSPSPTPTPSPTPSPSPTATESGSPAASPTESPTPSPVPTATPEPTPTPVPTPQLGFVVTDRGRIHVPTGQTVQYAECPPTSGPHYAAPAKRGYYAPDQTLPVGAWIHSLEHGMIVVLYSCGPDGNACPDGNTQAALKTLADTAPQTDVAKQCGIKNKIIVTRFDKMSTRFAAVGWDRAMLSDTFDPATFLTFYQQWVDNSPTEEAKGCDGPTGAE
jgi:Protein of unknown function (DUF3105)